MRKTLYSLALILVTAIVTLGAAAAVMAGSGVAALLPLRELMTAIRAEHLDPPSEEELIRGAAEGMIAALDDPYAAYFSDEEYESYLSELDGEYEGIGILAGQPDEKGLPVLRVHPDSAAERAGMRSGDTIAEADGQPLGGLTLEDAARHIRGEVGSLIRLRVLRGEEELAFEIRREKGNAPHVRWERKGDVGYIRVERFSGNCDAEFERAIDELTEEGVQSLLIDLRDNPGGELTKVVAMADMVLGECLILKVGEEEFRSDKNKISLPLAVLVNENSASASEVFAGAVQQAGAGTVIGTRTYGKGVVQTTMRLRSGDWLKMTTDEYTLAGGKRIHGVGVEPDVPMDDAEGIMDWN